MPARGTWEDWITQRLTGWLALAGDGIQIDPATRFSSGDREIFIGALAWAAAAARAEKWPTGSQMEFELFRLEKDLARNASIRAKGSESDGGDHFNYIPSEFWSKPAFADSAFTEHMYSKAGRPRRGWEWHHISLELSDLQKYWPEVWLGALGIPDGPELSGRLRFEMTEAVTLTAIGRAVRSAEIQQHLWSIPEKSLPLDEGVVDMITRFKDAAASGRIEIQGLPAYGFGIDGDPHLVGRQEIVPRSTFGSGAKLALSANAVWMFDPRRSGAWSGFAHLTVCSEELRGLLDLLREGAILTETEAVGGGTSAPKLARQAQTFIKNHLEQWTITWPMVREHLYKENGADPGERPFKRLKEKVEERYPWMARPGKRPKTKPARWPPAC